MTGGLSLREDQTVDQPRQEQQEELQETIESDAPAGSPDQTVTDRAPVATSLRVILLLSVISWALVILAIVWLARIP